MNENEIISQNEHFLTNSFNDKYLYSVNHNVLNKTGALETHGERLSPLLQKKDTLYIVIGTDSGTILSYLNTQEINPGAHFLFIELKGVLDNLKHNGLLQKGKNISIGTIDSFEDLVHKVEITSYLYIDKVEILKSLAADYAFIPEYHDLFFTVQEKLHQISWSLENTLGTQPFIRAQLKNIAEYITSASCLKKSFPGKTAVLLAGGPSLDEVIPWVQANRNNLVVLAVSRVSRRLKEVDLTPDIIFSIDPHQMSFDISKEMLNLWEHTLFVHINHVSPKLLGQWRGESMYVGDRVPWQSRLNEETLPTAGPTVSNFALSVATEMQFSQIILAGVDLCHNKQGYTHAQGSNESVAGPQLTKPCTKVETNGGWFAETTSDFSASISILNSQALRAKEKGVHFINPSPGAAKVEQIQHIDLAQIHLSPLDPQPDQIIKTLYSPVTISDRKRYYETVLKELSRVHGQLIKIQKLTRDALHCNDHLFGREGKNQDFKFKKRMDKIENKLNTKYSNITRLVKTYGIRNFLKITRIDKESEWETQEIEATAATYYKTYFNTASALIALIKDSKNRTVSRLGELSTAPDYESLFTQWNKDEQYGRLFIFLQQKSLNIYQLPEDIRGNAVNLAAKEQDVRQKNDTLHMKRSQEYAELAGVTGKLRMHFKKQDTVSLAELVNVLENHSNPKAQSYYYLGTGYLAELNANIKTALKNYRKLLQCDDNLLLEEALKEITSISLKKNDSESSLESLERLSQISPNYGPQHADLLRILGRHQDAIEVYITYLEKVPTDTTVMLKLGIYYHELQIPEGAEAMFRHVLLLEPENRKAAKLLVEM